MSLYYAGPIELLFPWIKSYLYSTIMCIKVLFSPIFMERTGKIKIKLFINFYYSIFIE